MLYQFGLHVCTRMSCFKRNVYVANIYILTNRFVHACIIKVCFETNYFIFILRLKQVFYFIWGGGSKLKKLGFVSHLALYVNKTMFWFKRVGIFIINVRLQLLYMCVYNISICRETGFIMAGSVSIDALQMFLWEKFLCIWS